MPDHKPLKPTTVSPAINLISVAQALLVGECLSFRRAAEVLGVQQSAVSRRVRALEDELGVSLFERHRAGVRITNAGARFLQEARDVLRGLDTAVGTARAAGGGNIGSVSIGTLSSMASGFLRELIEVYSARHPDVAIQIQEGTSTEHIGLIRRRQLDVAFVMDTAGASDCDVARLWCERIFVVLPRSHPLCDREVIGWEALRGERLIVRKSECNPGLCELVIERLTDRDHSPEVQKLNVSRGTLIHLVGLGMGIGLTSEATAGTPFSEVEFRPIADADTILQFSVVWLSNNDNPALRRFLSLARAQAKQKRKESGGGPIGGARRLSSVSGISLTFGFVAALARKLGLWT